MTDFTSPVGRMVQGDCFAPQTTDQQGNPRVVQSGPNMGKPSPQWFVALAFAKTDPAWPKFRADIDAASVAAWPTLFRGAQCVLPTFSNKIIDGDGVDTTGRSNATKEGFAGHWVVRFSSGFAPKVFPAGRYSPADQIHDPGLARRGYYYRIAGSLVSNMNATKPGMYMNVSLIELAGHGVEIVAGPDPAAAFAAPATLPPGASQTPVAGPALPAGTGTTPATGAAAGVVPPYGGFLAPPPAPPAPVAAPAPPLGPGQMLPAATASYEAYKAAGWNDLQLIQAGLMVDYIPH